MQCIGVFLLCEDIPCTTGWDEANVQSKTDLKG